MRTDRYNGHRHGGFDINGMGLALVATAAMVFALTLTTRHFTRIEDTPLVTRNIELTPPPPPRPEPKPEPQIRKVEPNPLPRPDPVDTSHPPVEAHPSDFFPTKIEGTIDPGPIAGTGDDRALPLPPVHIPVERAARLDTRYADTFQPDYPMGERDAARAGRVVVRVLIGTDGRVKAVEQISAASAAFFEATRKRALAKWRFVPATRDGMAIETWQQIGVTFELDG